MGIVNAITSGWLSIIKNNSSTKRIDFNENSFYLPVKGEKLDVSSCSSKIVYKESISFKAVPPTARAKWEEQYPTLSEDKWKKIYSLAFNVTLDTKLRAFKYIFLNRIAYTNEKLFAFKITDSPLCTFCKKEVESTEHLFFSCVKLLLSFSK